MSTIKQFNISVKIIYTLLFIIMRAAEGYHTIIIDNLLPSWNYLKGLLTDGHNWDIST